MFATGPSISTRLLVALLLSIALLVIDKTSARLAGVRAAISIAVYPILAVVNLPADFIHEFIESATTFADLKAENRQLKEQRFISDTKLLKFAALEKENIRLRSLLESSYSLGEQVMVAEILSVNQAPFDHVVLVNKGSRFGLHTKQPVMDTQGVIGQVVRTLPLSADIMLITDPNHAIPVQVNRNGLRTIAVGSGQLNRLILPYLPNNADIKKGDLLITSGLGGTFPQGYPVAVVDDFQVQAHKPFAYISATPKAALDKIREVLIVWNNPKSVPLNLPAIPANNSAANPPPVPANPPIPSALLPPAPSAPPLAADIQGDKKAPLPPEPEVDGE